MVDPGGSVDLRSDSILSLEAVVETGDVRAEEEDKRRVQLNDISTTEGSRETHRILTMAGDRDVL